MASDSILAGMEVPLVGSASVKWIGLSVPSSPSTAASPHFAPLTQDYASCSFIGGDTPTSLLWRIHKTLPHTLELLELRASAEFPSIGLRITFPDALSPFAFICKNEIDFTSGTPYLLYALTVSGIAYAFRLKSISTYAPGSVFPPSEFIEVNLQTFLNSGAITAAAATAGCLVVGRFDGSVCCFQLGMLDQNAPGFVHELRDDYGIGRLWGLMSRGRMVGAVQDLVILKVEGKELAFVLHVDGVLRVWDLSCQSRIFSHAMSIPSLTGAASVRLWLGDANHDSRVIPMAIFYRCTSEVSLETIHVYNFRFGLGDKIILVLDPSVQNISLEEGGCIDVKLTSDKIYILKEKGLVFYKLFQDTANVEEAHYYSLQEEFVADQLFQSTEHSYNNILSTIHSIFSSSKMLDYMVPFVSSIFLRRLLHLGVHQSSVLRETLLDYNRHWTDSEFRSLTVDGLKKEILSLIEHEGIMESPMSTLYWWKNFFARYFHYWCKNNAAYGLLVESSADAVGLCRKNSISIFCCSENIELLIHGSFDELDNLFSFEFDLSDDDLEREILIEVLRSVISINQQLGKTAASIYYESLVSTPIMSAEETIPCLMKILETGYGSSVTAPNRSDIGVDIAQEKELADHKTLRKFSIDMMLCLNALWKKAATWDRVLNVIESYLKFLVPCKVVQENDADLLFDLNTSIWVQATSQIAKVMFESAFDVLLFLSYLVNIAGQINLFHEDISRIQLELIPMIQEILSEWLIIHLFCTMPSESPEIEDFSSQLSLLKIDSNSDNRSWKEKLGKCDFTLAFVLLHNLQITSKEQSYLCPRCLPIPQEVNSSVRNFISFIIWERIGEESTAFFSRSTELAMILLRHGQYNAVETLLTIVETHSRKEKISVSSQNTDGKWCILHHILGCCFLAQAQCRLKGVLKEKKIDEAIRCFFRASSGQGGFQALQDLVHEAGFPPLNSTGFVSSYAWKFHYYQWVMQIFEQYNISEGACQFALAALEQVDEALGSEDESYQIDSLIESATTIKGRLWANVFKFALDLNHLNDAYCAIISNPDEESKFICLRRFIIVLYERGSIKILCDGQLPLIGLTEKVERELAWKAERSDIMAKPNPYKLLYSFEMYRHNWRSAANYMYVYSARLRSEAALKDFQHTTLALQERLNGLSAAINALSLVHPAYAWIYPPIEGFLLKSDHYPSKKARRTGEEKQASNDIHYKGLESYIDIESLENEFLLTYAEYLLSLQNVKWTFTGVHKAPSDLIDLLVQSDLYDLALTVLLKFWKGSGLKRELERVFSAMSLKCCPNQLGSLLVRNDPKTQSLLLTSSNHEVVVHCSTDMTPTTQQSKGKSQWEMLELYLDKYIHFDARLPVTIAETLLRTNPLIELPLWLVQKFKDGRGEKAWGMTGQESNPASLFRLYVDYSRYTEATNLILEYTKLYASMRPIGIIKRKMPFAAWFPYTTIERLWCQIEELINAGQMVDQCGKLKGLLYGALQSHLKLLNVDSEDALAAAAI